MKLGDKVICKKHYLMDIIDINCPLKCYAEIEEDMEGYIEEFISPDEVSVNFYGVSIMIETADFVSGVFMLARELSALYLLQGEKDKIN